MYSNAPKYANGKKKKIKVKIKTNIQSKISTSKYQLLSKIQNVVFSVYNNNAFEIYTF